MSGEATTPSYRADELLAFASALFRRAGLDPDKAGTFTEILVEGDLLGHTTPGLALAAPYLAALDSGSMAGDGEPAVISDHRAAMCWDGRRLPGPWLVVRAIEQALARVPEHGTPQSPFARSITSAASPRISSGRARGCLIVLTCSDPSEASVAPYGGLQALFTPDPHLVWSSSSGDPVLIDMSASITTNDMTGRCARRAGAFPGDGP